MPEVQFSETTLPTLAIWGLGLGVLLIGFLIGYLDSNVRSAQKIEAAEAKAEVVRTESEKRMAEAESLKSQAPKVVDDPGLLRLRNKDGMPLLEMDGVILNTKSITADQKKRLVELLSVIRPWLESGPSISSAPIQTASTPKPSVPRPAPVQPAVSALSPSATQPLPITRALTEKEFKALSIIDQIDRVFQSQIAGTPYESLGIRIFEGSVGSVEVMVGVNKYPSIDDVPDADIKKIIRAAIAEWEEKYTPRQ